jgi:hypothetical protein
MVVGPGEADMAIDTLESILAFYPGAFLWIRDDRTSDGTWEKLCEWAEGKAVRLSRNRIVQEYLGVARSTCDLLHTIVAAGAVPEIVIKIDPDAIFLRPGLVEIFRQRFTEKGPGACGSYDIGPDGRKRRGNFHAVKFIRDLLPIGLGHKKSLRLKPVFYWKHLVRALRNGYSFGEHILGAVLAFHGTTLIAMDRAGFLGSVPERHNSCVRMDDVLISMAVKSVGHALISVNSYPDKVVAWLKAARPLGITREEAWNRKYLAVHPVKKVDEELRRFFREKRTAAAAELLRTVPMG